MMYFPLELRLGIVCVFCLIYQAPFVFRQPNTSQEYIYVYPDSGLTYPAAEHVRAVVTDAALLHGRGTEPVVVDCSHIRYSDFTSAEVGGASGVSAFRAGGASGVSGF